MKKLAKFILAAIFGTVMLCFAACGGYDVTLPIGDGSKENDSVTAAFKIDETLTDGYELKVTFTAESEADLSRDFIFALAFSDPLFSSQYEENVLCSVKGSALAEGEQKFAVKFDSLSDYFGETGEAKKFYLVLHADGTDRSGNITEWNSSEYSYTFDGKKLKLTK